MSITAPAPEVTTLAAPAEPALRTFRGRSLEELLPRIRDQLGPDAVVLRQRDGLMGGIGGFFQQRFVEIDARPGARRIDAYDEEPPAPVPDAFAQPLAAAEDRGPRVSTSDRCTDPHSYESPVAGLTQAGMSHAFADGLAADAEAHELPFASDLREAVRRAVSRRLPTALPHRVGGLAVAFAGPGSTACATALAAAYKRAGRDARAVASLDKAHTLLERGNPDAVLAVDLPPVAADRDEVDSLARRVEQLALDELIAAIPANLDLPTARQLLDRLQPLNPTALALSLDAENADIGAAIELACTTRLPIAYVHDAHDGIIRANPHALAERLLR
jgi:hypothetical protein